MAREENSVALNRIELGSEWGKMNMGERTNWEADELRGERERAGGLD